MTEADAGEVGVSCKEVGLSRGCYSPDAVHFRLGTFRLSYPLRVHLFSTEPLRMTVIW
jgi:hypothetical protein